VDPVEVFLRNALKQKGVEDRAIRAALKRLRPVMAQIKLLLADSGVFTLRPDRERLIAAVTSRAAQIIAQEWGQPALAQFQEALAPYLETQTQFARDMVQSAGGTLSSPGVVIPSPMAATQQALVGGRPLADQMVLGIPAQAAERLSQFIRLSTGVEPGEVLARYENAVVRKVENTIQATITSGVQSTGDLYQLAVYQLEADPAWLEGKFQWTATLDSHTCPTCIGLDGAEYKLGESGRQWDGQSKIDPHFNCRCYMVPAKWRKDGQERIVEGDSGEAALNFRRSAKVWVRENPETAREIFGSTIGSRLVGSWPDNAWGRRQQDKYGAPEVISFNKALKIWQSPAPD
jgi:hypothetical protein